MCISIFSGAFVNATEDTSFISPVTYAQSFIDVVAADKGLTAYESIQIYDEEDLLSGFCVSLKKNETPSGYVVIKFTQDGEPIVSEYAVDANMEDVYDEIEQTVEKTKGKKPKKKNKEEKKLYSFTPNDYFISANEGNNETFFDNTGKEMSKEDFKAFKKEMKKQKKEMLKIKKEQKKEEIARRKAEKKAIDPELLEEEIVYSSAHGSMITSRDEAISKDYTGTNAYEKDAEKAEGRYWWGQTDTNYYGVKYACSVVAMMNALRYCLYKGAPSLINTNNFVGAYEHLFTLAKTDKNTGYTYWDDIGPAMRAYCAYNHYSCVDNGYWFVRFSDFVRDINAKKPCIFGYNWKQNGESKGHSVYVCGYVTTDQDKYLKVADGSFAQKARYFNFSGYSFTDTQGVSFDIGLTPYK